jgi:benzoate-CoA ligase
VAGERYNVSSIVERQVQAGRGDAPAYIAADARLTYEQLRQRVNQAGHLLRHLGIGREQRVLLVLDDTTAFPALFLGAIRIGAVPVPVSPRDKDDNFRHFIDDSYAELVVTDADCLERLRGVLSGSGVRWLVRGTGGGLEGVEDLEQGLAAQEAELDPAPTHRDDVAFWLYSSGSTGKPKGVVHLQHDIEVTCANFAEQVLGLRADDVTFSTTKLFHAYGLGNGLSFPLWVGATSVLMAGPTKPQPIINTLREHRPTVFFSVPALFSLLSRDPQADGALDSVRFCVSAAEPLPADTGRRWRERFGIELVDGIGSTEMLHIYCSNRPDRVQLGTSGWPVPGYDLRLVDEQGRILEGPGTGVLHVRGDSCAAQYWHQHEKTKSTMLGEWYVSGDRYTRLEDGAYSYVGRVDDMLKVGGLWVSPVDMEQVLMEHSDVTGAGVIGVSQDGTTRLAAFVESVGGGSDQLADELRALCKSRLRRYEYPHLVMFVDELPRTLTGKVQRFRLRELASDAISTGGVAEPAASVAEPETPTTP